MKKSHQYIVLALLYLFLKSILQYMYCKLKKEMIYRKTRLHKEKKKEKKSTQIELKAFYFLLRV